MIATEVKFIISIAEDARVRLKQNNIIHRRGVVLYSVNRASPSRGPCSEVPGVVPLPAVEIDAAWILDPGSWL